MNGDRHTHQGVRQSRSRADVSAGCTGENCDTEVSEIRIRPSENLCVRRCIGQSQADQTTGEVEVGRPDEQPHKFGLLTQGIRVEFSLFDLKRYGFCVALATYPESTAWGLGAADGGGCGASGLSVVLSWVWGVLNWFRGVLRGVRDAGSGLGRVGPLGCVVSRLGRVGRAGSRAWW